MSNFGTVCFRLSDKILFISISYSKFFKLIWPSFPKMDNPKLAGWRPVFIVCILDERKRKYSGRRKNCQKPDFPGFSCFFFCLKPSIGVFSTLNMQWCPTVFVVSWRVMLHGAEQFGSHKKVLIKCNLTLAMSPTCQSTSPLPIDLAYTITCNGKLAACPLVMWDTWILAKKLHVELDFIFKSVVNIFYTLPSKRSILC